MRPAFGGLTLGLLAFWSPFALTFGEAQINGLAARKAVVGVFVVAALAKLIGTTVTNTAPINTPRAIPVKMYGRPSC